MSLTQYMAGGLIRWAACAFKSAKTTSEIPTASENPLDMLMSIQEFHENHCILMHDE